MEGATVITLDGKRTIYAPGQLTWENGEIISVGPEDSDPTPVDQLILLTDAYLLPGLINGHNHAAMALLRGVADDSPLFEWLQDHIFPLEAKLTAEDIYIGTLLACAEMIHGGTVGFADMYFHVDQVAQAVEQAGLRAWIARGITGDAETGQQSLKESLEFAAKWREHRRITPMLGPHAPYTVSFDLLEQVASAAQTYDLSIHIHLAESPQEIADLAQRKTTPFALASAAGLLSSRILIAHGTHVSPSDVDYLAGIRGGIITCPVSNAKLGNGILPYAMLRDAGIMVGLGTDGPASTNSLDMFLEMKAMAWLQKLAGGRPETFRADEALTAATTGTASVLGHSGGQLAVGRPADFIVVGRRSAHLIPEHDPIANLVYAAQSKDVRYTVVDGQILMAEGIITAFDEQAVMVEAESRAKMLIS